ncbi:MAG: YraN family protein [Calothrix sp. FI2-JRJ7]|jgi:putative endonuclease|nr:YraN family protein [Calothrix sp. FI2-JRJ7]
MAPSNHYLDIGTLGEDFVAEWLAENGSKILHRRWKSGRRGEIDIIALVEAKEKINITTQDLTLAFVEVKTRSARNWDSGGRYAVESRKQTKLRIAAQMFLAEHPDKENYTCRFDVAIVCCKPKPKSQHAENLEYYLTLQEYITGAFD